jgi:putative FmdB family regulatory protein
MPIFEYRCAACGRRYESLISRHDAPAQPCPGCGASRSQRLPSAFAVVGSTATVEAGPCGSHDCACRRGTSAD